MTAAPRAFGAEVELIPSPDGITPGLIPSMMRRAAEIAAQTGAGRLGPGHRVVTLQVDSGLKYLTGPLYSS